MRGGISIGAVLLPIHREPGARSSIRALCCCCCCEESPDNGPAQHVVGFLNTTTTVNYIIFRYFHTSA
jgi:hypothetical protein